MKTSCMMIWIYIKSSEYSAMVLCSSENFGRQPKSNPDNNS